jgi:hypothetical protein
MPGRVLPQLVNRQPLQVPRVSLVGERFAFDPNRLDIRKDNGSWYLVAGNQNLAALKGNEYDARNVLRVARDFPFTEQCRIGPVEFYMTRGRVPGSLPLSIRTHPFRAEALQVVPADGKFELRAGQKVVAVTKSQDEAAQTVQVLKHYQFDRLAEVGSNFRFLARGR